MGIRIEVLDTSKGPMGAGGAERDIELPAVPREGETIHFYDADGDGRDHSITVKAVLWLPQSGEAQVQIRGW